MTENVIFEGKEYKINSYTIFTSGGSYIDSNYITITNDSIFILDYNEFCPKVWCLGSLDQNVNETFSLNTECGRSSLIENLVSEIKLVDTIQDEIIYNFNLSQGDNSNSLETERMMLFSKKRGIISIIKNDTIAESPFW